MSRLIRFGSPRQEKPGLLDADGRRRDCSALVPDWHTNAWADGLPGTLCNTDPTTLPLVPESERWGAPVARPGKLIGIGLNYRDHAEESGMPIPEEPIVFMKASNTVSGPYDAVPIPRGSEKTDWEVELGVVIGREARYLSDESAAAQVIGGYCVSHDVSERAFQLERGGQWTKGKSCDGFNPLGPWVLTADELPDPQTLGMWLTVNGERRQTGNTATMIFGVFHLVYYLSQFMTLEPGDVITTGTPPGVGLGMKPPQFLRVGDEVELGIDRLGSQRQRFGEARL